MESKWLWSDSKGKYMDGGEERGELWKKNVHFFHSLVYWKFGMIFLVGSTTWFDQLTTKSKGWGLERWVSNLMVFGSKYRSQRCAESTPSGFLRLRFWQLSKLLCFTNCKSLSLSFSLHFPWSGYFRISSTVQELPWCHFACGFVTHKSANNNNNKMVLESFALFSSSFKSKDQLTCYFPTLKNGTRKYKLFDCIWIVKYIIVSSHH